MSRLRFIVVLLGISSCTSGTGSTTSTTTTTTTTTSTSTTTTTTTSTSTSGGGGGDGILQCVETCDVPSDCCVPGQPCPGAYPYNVDCIDALCVPPVCADDAECDAVAAGSSCRPVRGYAACVLACSDDTPCTDAQLGTCDGLDDDGAGFCMVRCDAPGQFCGNQICDAATGLCTCSGDGNCQSDWRCLD